MDKREMNRREFAQSIGFFTVAALSSSAIAALLTSCSSDDNPAGPTGSNTGGQLKVSLSENTELEQVGGFKTFRVNAEPIIVIHASENSFRTFTLVCTHQACTVSWQSSSRIFQCPCHGSRYDSNGKVTQGPAPRALAEYMTTFDASQNIVTVDFG
ncbi:hypothetical protein A2V82_16175 [candidate division KSB1 bacterium RBG_16_48_16]|nr:MAG: hypothetical protein A2V82_16175 [candidate division KSB1 bacterium RBG_16_48_16]